MNDFNDIGISRKLDRQRIRKPLAIGAFASVLHLGGDMIPGFGVRVEARSGRSGIFGYLIFGVCVFRVPTCAFVFLAKNGMADKLLMQYAVRFILPAVALFRIFFLILEIT